MGRDNSDKGLRQGGDDNGFLKYGLDFSSDGSGKINKDIGIEALRQVVEDVVYDVLHDIWSSSNDINRFEKRVVDLRRLFRDNGIWDEG